MLIDQQNITKSHEFSAFFTCLLLLVKMWISCKLHAVTFIVFFTCVWTFSVVNHPTLFCLNLKWYKTKWHVIDGSVIKHKCLDCGICLPKLHIRNQNENSQMTFPDFPDLACIDVTTYSKEHYDTSYTAPTNREIEIKSDKILVWCS